MPLDRVTGEAAGFEQLLAHREDHREMLREKVAAQHGFQLYKRYSEKDAARQIGFDYSTLKRKRRANLVPFVDVGGGSVGYMGYQIADIILFGVKAKEPWESTPNARSSVVSGGSVLRPGAAATSAASSKDDRSSASALALAMLTKRKSA
jgi:hypothetical protein